MNKNKITRINWQSKNRKFLINWLFIISGTAMAGLLSRAEIPILVLSVLISIFILYVLTFKYRFIDGVFENTNKIQVLISATFSLVVTNNLLIYHYNRKFSTLRHILNQLFMMAVEYQNIFIKILIISSVVIALFAIFMFLCYFLIIFFKISGVLIKDSNKLEKRYLIISGVVLAIAILIIYHSTNVFYSATADGLLTDGVIFTTDTAYLVEKNAYMNIFGRENDIRQPLFGLFAMPFAVLATLLSKIFFFMPNSYPIILNIIQVFLLQISIILISRMLKFKSVNNLMFLLTMNVTYPFLLFSLNMEQYIFSVFWLILFIYACLLKLGDKEFFFISATGSLLTTGVLIPLISNSKTIGGFFKEIITVGVKLFGIFILFGKLPIMLNVIPGIQEHMYLMGINLTFKNKLMQYFNFISSCLIKPNAGVDTIKYEHISYQLAEVTNFNILGIILLVVAILGFVLNYKDKYAQICMFWVSYSFFILGIIGWGTSENGLVIYSLYFSWAFISLIFKALDKIFQKIKPLKYTIYIGIIIILGINIQGVFELVEFGIKYYPVMK